MKLVIADDENLVRYAIRSMVSEMDAAWTVAGEATNGEDLLELLVEQQPNVAIVDIHMPGLNGLEAIRRGKVLSPMTKWLILTGYSDFQYAQEAVKLGASEYLLKPVSPDELERALYATYKDSREMLLLHNERFGSNLTALLHGLIAVRQEDREGVFHQGSFMGAVFEQDRPAGGPARAEAHAAFYRQLTACTDRHLNCGIHLAIVTLPGGELAAVGAWNVSIGCEGRRQVAGFFEDVLREARKASSQEESVTVLATGECRGFKELNARLAGLQQLRELRFFCGFGGVIEYGGLQSLAGRQELLTLGRKLTAAFEYLHEGRYLNFQNTALELEAAIKNWERTATEGERRSLFLYIGHAAPGIRLSDRSGADAVAQELRSYGERMLRQLQSKDIAQSDAVSQMLQYIDRHYAEEVAIGQIADLLNVTPSYLSTLFHKKTGMTFMKYLTRLRMGKAEELLLGTRLSIKQIAEAVGYFSTRHFTKLFTETFGKYPSDYRKSV
ncbi:response regulator transcription factor [Paenibacillus sacheonensis]|uniref:Helix-turn-helix domain-containing protein n=1 Tax=Paenibacillus sacheonensis TaxID=742054 RepID=A0A7X5C0A7_9BACL|nr:helix-turn-helix domain-containing protein [Paenibacillus sacheonensis]MBM7563214.1 two-component system response regulator YesN [Paenibacillus sacheonensis]NBC68224.1 helix-turn-helix domain-containing protein [Paenibacillus sacheonensis]